MYLPDICSLIKKKCYVPYIAHQQLGTISYLLHLADALMEHFLEGSALLRLW